ncbi:hypothetical protein [Halorubrum tropicale]|uniref:SWIM-type domain-containing protein n=1 Tax=Halorubrum tropicale TaxID=1765655 RepID=A0A0M9AHI7_9EURY|nr:hypothetical protein [Halorubrum tropicale]KOX92142.1 hypothetical protein AMR74_17000 [Halorubrum tropicale]
MASAENAATAVEPAGNTDLNDREVRALTEVMTALDEIGDVRGADDMYLVVSHSGKEYTVDGRSGACTCPDAEYNLGPDELCKHAERVAFATGEKPIPAWVDPADVDEQLGDHVDGHPRFGGAQ